MQRLFLGLENRSGVGLRFISGAARYGACHREEPYVPVHPAKFLREEPGWRTLSRERARRANAIQIERERKEEEAQSREVEVHKLTVELLNPTELMVTGDETLRQWREDQRLPVPSAEYTKKYKEGKWDGTHAPGKWCRKTWKDVWEMRCSRGLLGRLVKDFELETRATGCTREQALYWMRQQDLVQFRDYQRKALLYSLMLQWGRVGLATNAGKGAVIAMLTRFAKDTNLTALVLCDEIAVFDALQEEIMEWAGHTPNVVQQGVKEPPHNASVTLAMVPTLARRLNPPKSAADEEHERVPEWRRWLNGQDMVLLDEADKATADTWRNILANCRSSEWRVGFSGTFPNAEEKPYDDLRLDELMGHVLIEAKNVEMVKRKVSATPQVELQGFDATSAVLDIIAKVSNPDTPSIWLLKPPQRRQRVYEAAIVENTLRHTFIRNLIQPNTPTAIIVNRVQHGENLAKEIQGSVFLDGSITAKKRRETLAAFEAGEFHVLIVTKILDRGTNRLGIATDLIFVSGEGSTRQTLQRIGRGLRRTGGKEFLRLVDVIDRVYTNGDGRWKVGEMASRYLHAAARKRIKLYRDEGFDVEIITADE